MALDTIPLPYGCRDVKIYPIVSGVAATTGIDLPNARTFSFTEAESFSELRGDDGLVAVHGQGASVNWSLESGGISFEACKAMYGGTITESGVTPNQVKSFAKTKDDERPYFLVEGRAVSDSGGDFHVKLYQARCTGELTGEMSDGNFWLTGSKGQALPNPDGDLYEFTQNETSVELV
jgi:hypothetical protein